MMSLQDAQIRLQEVYRQIPMTAQMGVGLRHFDGHHLELTAPLEPNINDKMTAFAGSLGALTTFSGWFLLTLWAESELKGVGIDIAAAKASQHFQRPVRDAFWSSVDLPALEALNRCQDSVIRKGRGRLSLRIEVRDSQGVAVVAEADYALIRRQ